MELGETSRWERWLLFYYRLEGVQKFNLGLYFLVETVMSLILILLPIKIVFYKLLVSYEHLYTIFDSIVFLMFLAHLYLYLHYQLARIVRNPEIEKKLLVQNRVFKLRWLYLVNLEFLYDLLCLLIAIYEVTEPRDTLFDRLIEIVYLAKIYKIKIFHDRVRNYIVGTPFYPLYNFLFGFFILIILITYVGCVFYQIDYLLATHHYDYPNLLWINQSAWDGIIDSDFGIQLLYPLYWSIGTASAAAYGNVSATSPPDVLYNILCLYFEGFLFGFYISRLHSLADNMTKQETTLQGVYSTFEEHRQELGRQGENISSQLELRILSSIEFQQNLQPHLAAMENILSEELAVQIRQQIFREFLDLDPIGLWQHNQNLRKAVSLSILEVSAEAGQKLFDYHTIAPNDLLFLKEGRAQSWLELDHSPQFSCHHHKGTFLNIFAFLTDLKIEAAHTSLTSYSLLYVLKRRDFRNTLSPPEAIQFGALFNEIISFESSLVVSEPIGLYGDSLNRAKSDVLMMDPVRQSGYLQSILSRKDSSRTQGRVFADRKNLRSVRGWNMSGRRQVSVGVQCVWDASFQTDRVLLLQE